MCTMTRREIDKSAGHSQKAVITVKQRLDLGQTILQRSGFGRKHFFNPRDTTADIQ